MLMCKEYQCFACANISPQLAPLVKQSALNIVCDLCKRAGIPNIQSLQSTMLEIKELGTKTYQATESLEKRMGTIESKVENMSTEIENMVDSKIEKNYNKVIQVIDTKLEVIKKETVSKQDLEEHINKIVTQKTTNVQDTILSEVTKIVETKVADHQTKNDPKGFDKLSPNSKMKHTVHEVSGEMKERERRECNIIVHGLQGDDTDVPRDMRVEEDKKSILKIITDHVTKNVKEDDFTESFRLGSKMAKKPRPLLIKMTSIKKKEEIMRNLKNLRDTDVKITFSHDLTMLQRENNKKLREQAEELTKNDQTDQFLFKVRGGRIRKFHKKDPKTPID